MNTNANDQFWYCAGLAVVTFAAVRVLGQWLGW